MIPAKKLQRAQSWIVNIWSSSGCGGCSQRGRGNSKTLIDMASMECAQHPQRTGEAVGGDAAQREFVESRKLD